MWGAHTAGGFDTRGRHTFDHDAIRAAGGGERWHNGGGIAISSAANLHDFAIDLAPWLPAQNGLHGWLRGELPNLGDVRPVDTMGLYRPARPHTIIFGHGDVAQTACPGDHMYAQLPKMRIEEEFDMATTEEIKRDLRAEFKQADEDTRKYVALAGQHSRDVLNFSVQVAKYAENVNNGLTNVRAALEGHLASEHTNAAHDDEGVRAALARLDEVEASLRGIASGAAVIATAAGAHELLLPPGE
jgi:hypothetical protein